jgi:fatty acid-binding protein DegV
LLFSTEALFSQEKVKVFDLSVKDFEVKNFDKNENNKENSFIYFEQDQEGSQTRTSNT